MPFREARSNCAGRSEQPWLRITNRELDSGTSTGTLFGSGKSRSGVSLMAAAAAANV